MLFNWLIVFFSLSVSHTNTHTTHIYIKKDLKSAVSLFAHATKLVDRAPRADFPQLIIFAFLLFIIICCEVRERVLIIHNIYIESDTIDGWSREI